MSPPDQRKGIRPRAAQKCYHAIEKTPQPSCGDCGEPDDASSPKGDSPSRIALSVPALRRPCGREGTTSRKSRRTYYTTTTTACKGLPPMPRSSVERGPRRAGGRWRIGRLPWKRAVSYNFRLGCQRADRVFRRAGDAGLAF